jgi:hypothetical protein
MPLVITGREGAIRWGYRTIGAVRDWRLATIDGSLTLTATVVTLDEFAASQRPLTFSARQGMWRWPIDTLQHSHGALTARLGAQE